MSLYFYWDISILLFKFPEIKKNKKASLDMIVTIKTNEAMGHIPHFTIADQEISWRYLNPQNMQILRDTELIISMQQLLPMACT